MYVFVEVATTFVIYGLLILGLNLQYGFAGLVNFGHVVFFAVGAYTVAILSAQNTFAGIGLGLPWPIAVVAGVGTAALVGAIVAMTSLRLRGDFLAIVTLATAEIFHSITVNFKGIFGGNVGILGIPQPVANLAQNTQTAMTAHLLLFGGLTLVTLGGITRLTNAPYGRVLRAIRADELVSRSIGKPVFSYKMQSFVYGAALAGFAGGLFALYNGAVAPGFFTIQVTVTIWIGMLLGGAANHRAVLIGLAVIMSLRLFSRFALDITPISSSAFASVRLIIIGLILVAIIRFRPAGIFGDAKQLGVDT
ncbi:branched-chain amino acid transport system permease protein [Haloarcula quadrata]|uniref:Branched-chain amino acid transport system permease protein n=2 Tax=Haloarcula quadrata TaxID=182779 RepID=A0A495QQF5_9EURY|nr:branched-chain amino acid transport system permease protein [Haloarcula quadrata]